jgi:hypothetical protein
MITIVLYRVSTASRLSFTYRADPNDINEIMATAYPGWEIEAVIV